MPRKRAAARKREARRKRERATLTRALRRNPRHALRTRDFLRRASIAGLRLPVTVRLREGTTLGVSWVPTRSPLDGALFPAPSGEQSLDLAGSFPMVIDFDAGPGYGGPGNIQARSGPGGSITAAGPLVMSELAGCAATPPAFVEAATTHDGRRTDRRELDRADLGGHEPVQRSVERISRPQVERQVEGPRVHICVRDPWRVGRLRRPGVDRCERPVERRRADPLGRQLPDRSGDHGGRRDPLRQDDGRRRRSRRASRAATSGVAPPRRRCTGAGLPLSTPCTSASAPPLGEAVGPAPFPASLMMKTFSADILLGDRN